MSAPVIPDLRLVLFQRAIDSLEMLLDPCDAREVDYASLTMQTIAIALADIDVEVPAEFWSQFEDELRYLGVDPTALTGRKVREILTSRISNDTEVDAWIKGLAAWYAIVVAAAKFQSRSMYL
ncbi:MAG: hypothetical protein QXT27_07490 [Pyrobaculum sp.]